MISRNKGDYDSNYVNQPVGKEVAYYNDTEYLVINFNCILNGLFSVNGTVYSTVFPSNSYNEAVKKQKKIPFPFSVDFNWKYYIKLFAETCLGSYDSDHIILIRCNPAGYYCKNNYIHLESYITGEMASQIRIIEDNFVEKTHCHVSNELLYHSPIDGRIFAYDSWAYEKVAENISQIVFNGENKKENFYRFSQPLLKSMCKRLTNEILKGLENEFKEYDSKTAVEIERHFLENNTSDLFKNLNRLKRFLKDEGFNLMDYVKEQRGESINLKLLELYTKYMRLEISDIIAVIYIYTRIGNKKLLRTTVQNICNNADCLPLSRMKNFIIKNQEYLKKYKYLDETLRCELGFDLNKGMASYPIRIASSYYVILNPNGNDNLILDIGRGKTTPDIHYVISNDMTCGVDEIDFLTKDWTFYIERAKEGKGNVPLTLIIKDKIEFQQSLFFVDYCDVLKNENAIITLRENKSRINIDDYKCICNLEPLMDDNAKIFHIRDGLVDQIQYYVLSKYIEELSGCNVFYDDLYMTQVTLFNGIEVGKFCKEGKESFEKKRLSKLLSQRLVWAYDLSIMVPDFLYEKGWTNFVGVSDRNREGWMKKCAHFIMNISTIKLAAMKGLKYYCTLIMPSAYLGDKFCASDYIEYPNFTDDKNKNLEHEMMSCDAVVLHIRLGDWVSLGNKPNLGFIRICLNGLKKINEYSNIKFFIFSDDIPWCEAHQKEILGYDANDNDVYFIDHNKRENSYLDMKLMSLGKIIIGSHSGFSFMAAAMSKRKDIYISQNDWRNESMKHLGFNNKYDLVTTSRSYHFISRDMINIDDWEKESDKNDILLGAKDHNFNFYRYNLPHGNGRYAVHCKDIDADVSEFTMGLYDFVRNKIIQYETYKVEGDNWFNFTIGEGIEGLAVCLYAGICGHTSGHRIHVKDFSVHFKQDVE